MNCIARLRRERKISQKELGSLIGVAQNTVCNWEKGNREPDNESLRRMSEYFGVSVDYILGLSDESKELPPKTPKTRKKGVRIPVYGDTAAGVPILAIEDFDSDDPDDWEEITEDITVESTELVPETEATVPVPEETGSDTIYVEAGKGCFSFVSFSVLAVVLGAIALIARKGKR